MGFVDYEVDGHVAVITINRPKALNALNEDVLKDIEAAFGPERAISKSSV